MARTFKDKTAHRKVAKPEIQTRAYRRSKEGQSRTEEYYKCVERKGRSEGSNDDSTWDEDVQSLYEYLIDHQNEAA